MEHLMSDVQAYRLSPCKVYRVSFLNGDAAVQGVSIGRGRLASTDASVTLKGAVGVTSQFDLDGMSFPDGFTVFPTATTVTNIIIAYEDI